jgi:uncharacterized damage-inducible protein DinB
MTPSPIDAVIERYAIGPTLLAHAASGLTPEQERARPGPGAWSIAELVTHLVDSDLVAADRMKRVIAEPNPTLLAYDENAWIDRLRAQEMPVAEGVELFAANRRWMVHILKRCDEGDFARAGMHSEAGRQTLADLVVKYANHLDYHLKFLYGKRANLGVSVYPRYSRQPNE